MGTIYMWTNNINGKKYVGKCHGNVKDRYSKHINGHGNVPLKRAFDKYGVDNFTFEILHDGILDIFLNDYEIEAIKTHNTNAKRQNGWGYNLTDGGDGTLGFKQSAETRRKISETQKGKKVTAESIRKMSEAHKGKLHTAKTRQKMSESRKGEKHPNYGKTGEKHPNYGRKHTTESIRKMSEARKGKKVTAEARRNMSKAQRNRKPTSEEARRNMSEARKGKKHTAETRRKLSKANDTPERRAARKIFLSLPADMPLPEKRKHLRQKFPEKSRGTICRWCESFIRYPLNHE